MTTTFRLPDLGEGLTESEIVTWHVAQGDVVELNQVLAEVETAKAVVELPSPYAGRIVTLHAAEGEVVPVGAPLVEFDVVAGRDAPPHGSEPVTAPTEPAAVVPAAAAPPEPATTGPAEPAPERHAVLVGYGPRTDAGARPRRRPRSWDTVPYRRPDAVEHRHTTPRAMPPVRMLARHLGVDLDTVRGSGPDGLVRRADVEAAAGTDRAQEGYETQQEARASTIVPVTGLRKHTARAMVESAFSAPHAAVHSTVAVTETLALLRRTKDRAGEHPATFLSLVCRAVVLAAGRTPSANARFDADAGHIELFGPVHLGIAVATDRGLVVPTIPDADRLDAGALAAQIAARAAQAREGRLSMTELTGSTLTVTNVGVFGVDGGVPILNAGQSTIVALGAVRTRPWEHRGEVSLREVVTVTVAFDHRVLDGAEAAAFLTDVTDVLTDPAVVLMR